MDPVIPTQIVLRSRWLCLGFLLGLAQLSCTKEPLITSVNESELEFEGVEYRVVRLLPSQLELAWKGDDGVPMRGFEKVQAHYEKKNRKCVFLMNAGIYEPGGIPSGLHIQNSKRLLRLNRRSGKGNFYLKPNGVFCIFGGSKAGAMICSTSDCAAVFKKHKEVFPDSSIRLGLQSGPLLLAKGEIHPAFRHESASKLIRNGVGIDQKGRVVFVVTDKGEEVNLHGFARLFLHLGCQDALFLDGDISRMEVNPTKEIRSHLFGAIFVVTEPIEQAAE